MKKQLISMVLMAAMTVSMLTGCKTAGGKKAEAPSSGNQAAAEAKTEDEEKASEGGEDYSYHWKLATTESSDYYMTQLSQEFLDIVEEKTGGKVTGEVFASGQLGGWWMPWKAWKWEILILLWMVSVPLALWMIFSMYGVSPSCMTTRNINTGSGIIILTRYPIWWQSRAASVWCLLLME